MIVDRFERLLGCWSSRAEVEARLSGGVRNDVRCVRLDGSRYVARLTARPHKSVAWEIELLLHLAHCEVRVPRPLETRDGRFEVEGLVVFEWLEGDPPRTERDWREVTRTLGRLHDATRRWPQRPGFASSVALLSRDKGGDMDLAALPKHVADRCRTAWAKLSDQPTSVVHRDPHAGNVRISRDGVSLLDWDEARVDVSLLDFSDLPVGHAAVSQGLLSDVRAAGDAWEVASAWVKEPEYARRRLAQLESRTQGFDE